jgi:hypothetical protein
VVERAIAILAVALLVSVPSSAAAQEQGQAVVPPLLRFQAHQLDIAQSGSVIFSWSASAPVEFTVIKDFSGIVVFLNRTEVQANGTFVAPAEGLYSFRFHNPNDFSVTVQWTIRPVPSSFPLLPIVSVAIVLLILAVFAVRTFRRRASHRAARSVECQRCGAANERSRIRCFKCGQNL